MCKHASILLIAIFFLGCTVNRSGAQEVNLRVLPEKINGVLPKSMMKTYLLRIADEQWQKWKDDYENLKTPEQIIAYQKQLREKFIDAIGGLPERTPLNPQVTGVVQREGYRVEKVIFESQPKHYVTALMFIPESPKYHPPYPGVLIPCGHSKTSKACPFYQIQGAAMALHGMVGLVFDPINHAERGQVLGKNNKPRLDSVKAHTMIGVSSTFLGRNTARFVIWDGIRAIDYLQSHPAVDPKRIGCTGNSGGGAQTAYLMALDKRIYAAAPSCYITTFNKLLHTRGCQNSNQDIFGQLAFGMEHADYIMMRAPKPTLICAATKDFFNIEGTWESFRFAKRLYGRLGFAERVDLVENGDKHGYRLLLREGAARWMSRWLLGRDEAITEPEIQLLHKEETLCTPNGQVMLIKGARSTYDLNEDYENQLVEKRRELWSGTDRNQMLQRVRRIAGIQQLNELPQPQVEQVDTIKREGFRIEKLILKPEPGIYLPALKYVPEKSKPRGVTLYVNEDGKQAGAALDGPLEKSARNGQLVLAVDLRGNGETRKYEKSFCLPHFGGDGREVLMAYVLGHSYVGMRAEDVLVCARYAAEQVPGQKNKGVRLIAIGNIGVPALHAATLEPNLFASVKIQGMLVSWSNIIHGRFHFNQLINNVHGALTTYDLPDLAATLGDKITIEQPVNSMGKTLYSAHD